MNETIRSTDTIEQKIAITDDWIRNISEQQQVREIPVGVLRSTLEHLGANFKNLSLAGRNGLSMINEEKRKFGMNEVWGEVFKDYKKWVKTDYIPVYEVRKGIELPVMKNKFDIKNESRQASGRKDKGMVNFFMDLTAYASGVLSFEDFKLLLQTRSKNGWIQEKSPNKESKEKTKRILWNDEIEPGKKSYLEKKPNPETGEIVPEGKQLLRPASFPPDFPIKFWEWITSKKLNK